MIQIVRDKSFNERSVQKLQALARKLFGERMNCRYDYVTTISQEKSGKYRFVISELAESKEILR